MWAFREYTRVSAHTIFAHTIFTHAHVFTCVHAYMATVAVSSSYLPFSLSYNATIAVTLFFLYRAWAAPQRLEYKIAEEVCRIKKPNTVAIAPG